MFLERSLDQNCLEKLTAQQSIEMDDKAELIFRLISAGYLPPADQMSPQDGSPAWTLESIALMVGLEIETLVGLLSQKGH